MRLRSVIAYSPASWRFLFSQLQPTALPVLLFYPKGGHLYRRASRKWLVMYRRSPVTSSRGQRVQARASTWALVGTASTDSRCPGESRAYPNPATATLAMMAARFDRA